MDREELHDVELFVFADNLVFESLFFNGKSKITLLFEIVFRLHQGQIRENLILHVVHISGMRIIEAVVDGLSRENNLGGVKRELNPLQFFPYIKERWENKLEWNHGLGSGEERS